MDLEVVGRHALLFDDDATAAFINTSDALVEWNSLSIDRYDVRHLLSSPPPPRKLRRHHRSEDPSLDSELDRERYLDLPSPSDEDQEQDLQDGTKPVVAGGYNAVAFSYGNTDEAIEQKNNDAESGFRPPFQVPESLLQNLFQMLGAGTDFL
ncbi:hypothetical protein CMV_016062 [Castanea mollissima]|uniref:Suppressor of white apricot N-terminal domain-containing protein n=1 Tax=Castanea mollissima TaxID=60419 RepID=A0A8J4QUM6_9ROSI|nr:hypothetical protein CMV_016062 [Castanea mollissima]